MEFNCYRNWDWDISPISQTSRIERDYADALLTALQYNSYFSGGRSNGRTVMNNYIEKLKTNLVQDSVNNKIERVIFNNPATIVYWKDGTKITTQNKLV
jgi:hypothetical protein